MILKNGTFKKAYRAEGESFSGVLGMEILTYSPALEEGQRADLGKDITKAHKLSDKLNNKLQIPRSKIFAEFLNAKKNVNATQKETEDYNKAIVAKLAERERERKTVKGHQKKPKVIPEWDEAKALQEIIENNIFAKGRYLKDYCKVTLVADEDGKCLIVFTVDEAEKCAYCRTYYGKETYGHRP